METQQADKWCDDSLKEYDAIMVEAQTLVETPKAPGESALLRSARSRRMEGKVRVASGRADVAALVQQMMSYTSRGSVAIEVPEAQIDIKLVWNK